jgi:fatty-acyl-CoA synthase
MNATIGSLLATHARTVPDSPFSTFLAKGQIETISFEQLYDRSGAYAAAYAREGVRPGDVVVIILQHSPHLFYSFLGAILAGAIPTFMPFPSPKQRADLYFADHQTLFARIEPRLLVTYPELPQFDIPTLIASDAILEHDERVAPHDAKASDVACLQHSSGTTSLKKGVMLTHREILDEVVAYAKALDFTGRDSIASWLPLYHDMGFVACFMASAVLGTHLVALDPFEWTMRPTMLLDAIQTYRTTFTWLPNFAFSHLVNGSRKDAHWDLSSVRAFVNCSEPCKAATFARFAERFAPCGVRPEMLQVCYAMAENVFAVTQTTLGRAVAVVEAEGFADGVVSCGSPVDGVELDIRDDEICIRGPFLFDGYYKLPEKTREKLRDGWYHSGDLGFVRDGELYVTGRIDDMLIVGGRNHFAHEIEACVNLVPGLLPGRNVAIGVDDPRTDATVVVVLAECADDADRSAVVRAVRAEVLERIGLAVHAVVPLARGEMVKTTSGKVSRAKNRELYLSGKLSNGEPQ